MAKRRSLRVTKRRAFTPRRVDPVGEAAPTPEVAPHVLLGLQRQFGNAEVTRMLARRRADDEDLSPSPHDGDRPRSSSTVAGEKRAEEAAVGFPTRDAAKAIGPAVLQRVVKKLRTGSITLNAVAVLFDNGGQVVEAQPFNDQSSEVRFKNKPRPGDTRINHGSVRIDIAASWDFTLTGPSVVDNKGSAKLLVDTPFRIPAKPKEDDSPLKFKQPRLAGQESNGKGAALDPQPLLSADPDDDGGSVTASPRITFVEQNATTGGLSIGPIGAQTQNQSSDTQEFGKSFTAILEVDKSNPNPNPTPGPTPQPDPKKDSSPKVLKRFATATDFGVNKSVPSAQEVALLKGWWNGQFGLVPLPNQEARDAVRTGQAEVFVIGHASRTGSREHNLVLSKDRSDSVVQTLQQGDMMGASAKIQQAGSGLDQAKASGEAQTERNATTIFEALVSDDPKVTDKQ